MAATPMAAPLMVGTNSVMLTFAHRLTLVYALIVGLLFYTPMREVVLGGVMGLPADLSRYAAPGVQMIMLVVIVWG